MKTGLSFSERLNEILDEVNREHQDYSSGDLDETSDVDGTSSHYSLNHEEEDENYITPDSIYVRSRSANGKDDRVAFIYNPDGNMFYDYKHGTHNGIVNKNYKYYAELERNYDDIYKKRNALESVALLGRCGTISYKDDDGRLEFRHYVAFWNTNHEIYGALLEPCLQQLEKDGYITQDTLLSIPGMGITRISDKSGETKRQLNTLSDEQIEKIKLQRELHLMGPEQKKAAMLKLGLSPHGKKNEWQRGSEETNLVKPGQKWWAATSESQII